MLIDLHVHTLVSKCSRLSMNEILENARLKGLDGVCITDHDSAEASSGFKEGFQEDGLLVMFGMEYTTPQGDYLCFGPVEELRPDMDLPTLSQEMTRLGGALVAAHPCRVVKPADRRVFEKKLCPIVEVVNGGNTKFENVQAVLLARQHGLVQVSGSDAHSLDELGRLPTRFTSIIESREDLVRALNQGQCVPTTGQFKAA